MKAHSPKAGVLAAFTALSIAQFAARFSVRLHSPVLDVGDRAIDGVPSAIGGEPLPPEHGLPARLIVPGLYGSVSATKWLTEIELTRFDHFDHYWVDRGWASQAPIKTQSRIDTPKAVGRIPARSPGRDQVENPRTDSDGTFSACQTLLNGSGTPDSSISTPGNIRVHRNGLSPPADDR